MSQTTWGQPAVGITLKPWGVPAVLAGLALPVLLWGSSLAISIAQGSPGDLSTAEVAANLIATIIVFDGALVAAPIIVAMGRYHLSWRALGFRSLEGGAWWMPVAAAAGCYIAVIIYLSILTYGFGAETGQDVESLFDARSLLPLTGFATLVVAPLAEELFFRGFVFAGLIRPFGLYPAMLISGLLFGAFHVSGAESAWLVPAFTAIGALFAWVYWRTGSLWYSVATHFLFNSVSFAILAANS